MDIDGTMACNLSILFEGSEGIEVNGAHLTLAGGTLYGCVSVSRCRPENGTEIDGEATSYLLEVTFEGELLNVISLLPPAAILERQRQLKFLRVTYTARLSGSEIVQNSDSRNVLIPFHFVIPSSIYGVDKNVYLGNGEEPLPPSLSLFSDTIQSQEKESLLVRGECKITYGVRARLFTNTGRYAGEAFRPVHFIPTRDLPLPPLYARDFVSEYVPSASQRIGLCHWIQSSSELAILTEEPLPLQFGWDRTVFTTLCLRLRYHNPSSPGTSSRVSSAPPPPDISLVVQTTLEAVTFFSVSPQGILPELKNAEPGLEVVKEKVLCLTQTRKLRISTWFPLAERDSKDDLGYNNVNQRHRYKGPVAWQSTASLVFTYEGNECPIPTFACTYASRRHFLSLRIQLDGHCSARYRLRVPVQIIYNSGCLPDAPESTRLYEEPIADWALPPVYTA